MDTPLSATLDEIANALQIVANGPLKSAAGQIASIANRIFDLAGDVRRAETRKKEAEDG